MPEISSHIQPNFNSPAGFEGISVAPDIAETRLPEPSPLVPSDAAMDSPLQALMDSPSHDNQLLKDIRPNITQLEILSPNMYHGLCRDTLTTFATLSRQEQNPDRLAIFQRAAALLKDETSHQDLLFAYRNALHKG
ncbi:MAG: hypothetical protein ACAI35_22125 [Candidatus Methylacidiphilales bacterium]|nr:hypothetical protein [Candidatus Methylacidiphilales bacterium]